MRPSMGRIVHYRMDRVDFETVRQQRADDVSVGNDVFTGNVYPALVVRAWPDGSANLRVFLDGRDDLWVTSRHERNTQDPGNPEGHGCWFWPPRTRGDG